MSAFTRSEDTAELADFEIEHLFTEIIPGYGGDERIAYLLERLRLRGEQIYWRGAQRGDWQIVRILTSCTKGFEAAFLDVFLKPHADAMGLRRVPTGNILSPFAEMP